MIEQWQQQIAQARSDATPLQLCGGGSKGFYGQDSRGEALDLRAHRGVVEYEPTELVITARCGTPLAELESMLVEQGQCLPFEPPHFAVDGEDCATVGGCVAAGLSGPGRMRTGAVRDFVLGVRILDGQGQHMSFGGQVMKNVAGYDVSRLVVGSLGALGIITEVSFKVLPAPVAHTTVALEVDQARALAAMEKWAGEPLPITATAWYDNVLRVRLGGARSAVSAAAATIGGQLVGEAEAASFWRDLRDHRLGFFEPALSGERSLWRLSLPAGVEPIPDSLSPGGHLIEWNGCQRWLLGDDGASDIRAWAVERGGYGTLFRGSDKSSGVFTPLQAPVMALHRNLKKVLDPAGIFNPGRLYPDL